MNRFTNQVAVVTGGSTGIGLAIAKALLTEGAKRVYITGRTTKALDEAIALLGKGAVSVVSDVANISDLDKLKNEIEQHGDQLDVLFANAGIAETNDLGKTTESEFSNTFDINVKGVFFTVQMLLPLLKDGSSIVLTASNLAHKGMERMSLYSASKAAVRSFARSWANDLKARKIRVNAISPGPTQTPLMDKILKADGIPIDEFNNFLAGAIPLGYAAQPEEVASAALFLASSEASYINGVELDVDGGMSQI